MRIRTRLLLLVFAVWVPSAIGFGLLARATYVDRAEAARRQLEQLAVNVNELIERELDARAVMAQTLAASSALRQGQLEQFQQEAAAATRLTDNWVFVIDARRQLMNTLVPFSEMRPRERSRMQPLVAGAPRAEFNPSGPVTGRPALAVLARDPGDGPPSYNVGVSFQPQRIQALLPVQLPLPGMLVTSINQDHLIMARSREIDRWIGREATGEMRRRAQEGQAGFADSVTLDDVPSLSYLSRANSYGWRVVVALPLSVLASAARDATLRAFAAAVALLAIGLVLAAFAARRISEPVLALRRAAAALGHDEVPPMLDTPLAEANEVGQALHAAGLRARDAKQSLERGIQAAVAQAEDAQARLLEARKHEAIGRLTGGIAHDFNNLLQTISTGQQLLSRGRLDAAQQRVLQSAMRATAKASDLVRQMSAFGRAQPLAPRPIDLADLLLHSQELTRKAVGARITLAEQIEPGLPNVLADPVQLELALLNLVFNARDAMPDGGRIEILARPAQPAECTGLPPGRYVCIEVVDNGSGIDAETMSRIFEPYFTTKPVGAGSGLGLAQVHAFAQRSGGEIRMRSRIGAGTRAMLILPATQEPARPAHGDAPAARALLPLHILMVEDDLLVSSVVVPALENAGHRVRLCATADDAARLLAAAHDFDLLFTDMVMPGQMTGADLVAWCRDHQPHLPVVMATGYSTQEQRVEAELLRKPYGMETLLAALARAVQRVSAPPPPAPGP